MKSLIFKLIGSTLTGLIMFPVFRRVYNSLYENSSQFWINIFHQYVKFKVLGKFLWKIKLLNGKLVYSEVDMGNYKTLQFALDYKWHAPGIARVENIILDEIGQNGLHIDIGANLGMRSLCALSNKQETVMFEPNNEVSELNENRCKLNNFRNYSFVRKGVSSSTGKATFSIDSTSYKSSIQPEEKTEVVNTITIETISLDDWMKEYPLTNKRTLVKVDIEGHELDMVMGAKNFIRTIKPTLIIEINDKEKNFEKIFRFFGDENFLCFALHADRWDNNLLTRIVDLKTPEIHEVTDFLFTSDPSVILKLAKVTY